MQLYHVMCMYRGTFLLMETESYSFLGLLNVWRIMCHQLKMVIQEGNTLRKYHQRQLHPRVVLVQLKMIIQEESTLRNCNQRQLHPKKYVVQRNLVHHPRKLQRSLAPVQRSCHQRSLKSCLLLRKELLLQRDLLQRVVGNLQKSSHKFPIPSHPVTKELKSTLRYMYMYRQEYISICMVWLVHMSSNWSEPQLFRVMHRILFCPTAWLATPP